MTNAKLYLGSTMTKGLKSTGLNDSLEMGYTWKNDELFQMLINYT